MSRRAWRNGPISAQTKQDERSLAGQVNTYSTPLGVSLVVQMQASKGWMRSKILSWCAIQNR